MRRAIAAAAVAAIVCLIPAGCKAKRKQARVEEAGQDATLASTVHVADPRTAPQLVNGFYDVEQNAWRWTAGRFTVMLRPPRGAAEKGAVLNLKFAVPDVVLAKLKTISLDASVGGTTFPPETYTQAGEFTFQRDIPADLLKGDTVKVDFHLDKSLPPSGSDARELGVIVTSVGLESK